jgi:ribosome-binding protein aMBF1 (putative translation factor)
MPRRIPDEEKRLMGELYAKTQSVAEVARRTNIPYSTVYGYTRVLERINPETGQPYKSQTELENYRTRQRINPETGQPYKSRIEYLQHSARKRGFASLAECEKHRVIKKGFASTTEYKKHLAIKKGFASRTEYEQHLAKKKGFASLRDYEKHLAKKRGFASLRDYEKHLVIEKGFASLTKYEQHLAKKRQQKPINQELSDLIKVRLSELGDRTQKWLAEQLGITESAVSRYTGGRTTPRKRLQKKLFDALELPYQTLDDLLDDLYAE